ncbi:MAG: hypothetical protein F7B60_05645 [Desulfurococcales archaeon]|nr:hypothetical protein [Desulfurococcales archaeon]
MEISTIYYKNILGLLIVTFLLAMLLTPLILAEADSGDAMLTYAVDIGESGNDYAWGVARTDDGFISAGYTDSYGGVSALVVKVRDNTPLPLIEWEETIGTSNGNEKTYDIARVGNYYVMAGWNQTSSYSGQPIVFTIDGNGSLISAKIMNFGGANGWIFRVIPSSNDSYILVGYDSSFSVIALKMNVYGSVIWSKSYSSSDYLYLYGSALDYNTGVLYVAANEWIAGKSVILAINSTNGNLIWNKEMIISGSGSYVTMGVEVDSHDIVLLGYNVTSGNRDGFIVKISPQGVPLWGYVFGTSPCEVPMDAVIENQSILLTGYTQIGSMHGNNAFIAEINGNGGLSWFRVYGGNGDDWFYRLLASNDSITGLGGTNSFTGNDDLLIMKLSPNGELWGCNLTETLNENMINYRSVNITVDTVSISTNNITASISDYPAQVKHVSMPFKYICPKPPAQNIVGGKLIPLERNHYQLDLTVSSLLALSVLSLILITKKSYV